METLLLQDLPVWGLFLIALLYVVLPPAIRAVRQKLSGGGKPKNQIEEVLEQMQEVVQQMSKRVDQQQVTQERTNEYLDRLCRSLDRLEARMTNAERIQSASTRRDNGHEKSATPDK